MTSQLDTFEAELLQELRSTVATRSQQRRSPKAHSPHRFIRRSGLAAGAAAAAAVAVVFVPGVLADPAYAVSNGPQGTIEVQVNRLEDAAGLQHALAQRGVKANVQYLGIEKKCTLGRYQDAPDSAPDSSTMFSVGGNGITARIDGRDVAHGETVVIAASRISNGIYAEVGIAKGPVRACHPVSLSPADFPH